MKVLIIVPEISKSGGTERAAINLANMLNKQKVTVHILSLSSNERSEIFYPLSPEIQIKHLSLSRIPTGLFDKIKWNKEAIFSCKLQVKEVQPDIIIGQGHNVSSLLPFIRINNKVKLYGCEHIDYHTIPKISKIIMKIVYRFLDGVIVLSSSAQAKLKVLNRNVLIIPNSLSFFPKDISPVDKKRILMVGRLSVEKGYDRLVEVAQILVSKYPDWRIDIFGDGDIREELESRYKAAGLSNFITIYQPVKSIDKQYMDSSIVLLTSYTEALPMVVLEAQSCGVPVVGYMCEGTAQLISDGRNGFVIEDGNAPAMADKLSLLIESIELRREMGREGRKNANGYSFDSIALKWKELFSVVEKQY